MLSIKLTSRCSCYVFREYFAMKWEQCPPNSSAIFFKQPKQLNLVPRFPQSTVQYDCSIWQFGSLSWWVMCVLLANQNQEIFFKWIIKVFIESSHTWILQTYQTVLQQLYFSTCLYHCSSIKLLYIHGLLHGTSCSAQNNNNFLELLHITALWTAIYWSTVNLYLKNVTTPSSNQRLWLIPDRF